MKSVITVFYKQDTLALSDRIKKEISWQGFNLYIIIYQFFSHIYYNIIPL